MYLYSVHLRSSDSLKGLWQRKNQLTQRGIVYVIDCAFLESRMVRLKKIPFPGRASFPHQHHPSIHSFPPPLRHSLLIAYFRLTIALRFSIVNDADRSVNSSLPRPSTFIDTPRQTFSPPSTTFLRSPSLSEYFIFGRPVYLHILVGRVHPSSKSLEGIRPQWASGLLRQYASSQPSLCAICSARPPTLPLYITRLYYQHAVLDRLNWQIPLFSKPQPISRT